MKLAIGIILYALLFSACKKSDETPYPYELFPVKWEIKSKISVYANKKEIKDPAVIEAFIKGEESYFNVKKAGPPDTVSFMSFIAKDTVLVFQTKYIVKQEGDRLLFGGVIYLPVIPDENGFTSTPNIMSPFELPNNAGPYAYDQQGNFLMAHIFKYGKHPQAGVFVAYGHHSNMRLVLTGYKLSSGTWYNGSPLGHRLQKGIAFNEFDESGVNLLGQHDTLAVQRYEVTLK